MHRLVRAVATASAIIAGSMLGGAQATPIAAPGALHSAGATLDPTEKAQYFYGGYNYCWFPGGWRGPGWYVCDYGPWVSGLWWGGPFGWHGWRWHGPIYGGWRHGWHGGWHGGGWHGGGWHGGGWHHH